MPGGKAGSKSSTTRRIRLHGAARSKQHEEDEEVEAEEREIVVVGITAITKLNMTSKCRICRDKHGARIRCHVNAC